MNVQDFPNELHGVIDERLYRRLEQLYKMVFALQQQQPPSQPPLQQLVKQQLQLLGVLREPLIGQETPDPNLSTAATIPGAVTDVSASGDPNLTVTVTNPSSNPHISVTLSANPTFTTVNVTTSYKVGGTAVVGAQGAAIPDPTGGATIDAESRTAIIAILNFLRGWGAIA